MYTEENDSKFPRIANSPPGPPMDWRAELEDFYSTERKIFFCPMTTKTLAEGAPPKYAITVDTIWGRTSSYAANRWVLDPSVGAGHSAVNLRYWGTTNVPNAYRAPVMGDSCWWHRGHSEPNDMPPEYDGQPPTGTGSDGMRIYCIDRHNGGINILFMDWSVRKVGLKELWTLKWSRDYDTAGPWTRTGGVAPVDWPQWMRKLKDY